jgi:hypothetical protein
VNNGTDPNSQDIAQLISQQLAAVIPNTVVQVGESLRDTGSSGGGGDNGGGIGGTGSCTNGGNHGGTHTNGRQGCSYKSFMDFKLKEFYGNEGAVGALRWVEKMEYVLIISEVLEENWSIHLGIVALNKSNGPNYEPIYSPECNHTSWNID